MNPTISMKMIQRLSHKEEDISKSILRNSESNSIKENNKNKNKNKIKENDKDEFQSQTNLLYKKQNESDNLEQIKENIQIEQTFPNNDEINDISSSSFKLKLDRIITNSYFKIIIDFISFIFALTICIIYIVLTYYPFKDQTWYNILNYVIATFYNIVFILELYLAQHRCTFLLEIFNLIHLYTSIMPYFATVKINFIFKFVEGARVFHIFRCTEFIQRYLI